MSLICLFRQCRYRFMFNVKRHFIGGGSSGLMGVYQCTSCKTLSLGSARDNTYEPMWTNTIGRTVSGKELCGSTP